MINTVEQSPSCTRCGYDLSGIEVAQGTVKCPECGLMNLESEARTPFRKPRWVRKGLCFVASSPILIVLGVLCGVVSPGRSVVSSIGQLLVGASIVSPLLGPFLYSIYALALIPHGYSPFPRLLIALCWLASGVLSILVLGTLANLHLLP